MPRRRTGSVSGASFVKGNSFLLYVLYFILIAGICVLLYGWWDTNRFNVRQVEIELDRLPKSFDGFTILQVSDLHDRSDGKDGRALLRAIETLNFDMAALTGDLLDRHLPKRRKNVYALLEVLIDIAPVYFVEGNHEAEIGHWDSIKAELMDRGVRVLDNEAVTLMGKDEQLALCGIREEASPEEFEGLIPQDGCTVLLAHHPERIEDYAKTGVNLVLSGHAHGGHVRLFGQGLYSPDQGILPRYTSGVYLCGQTKLYVSRGAGNHSFLPPRIFNRPEIDLITLKTPSR